MLIIDSQRKANYVNYNVIKILDTLILLVLFSSRTGIQCSRYITTHGLGLNCNTDLSWFDNIVPCGLKDKGITSLARELQRDVPVHEVLPVFLKAFAKEFNCSIVEADA